MVILPDIDSYLQSLEKVFRWLLDAELKPKLTKCERLQDKVHYLGHVVSVKGVATGPAKIEAITKWEPLKNVKALQAI